MQAPSPFPYSGGSRMTQALVPALQGPNSNSMLGYALGAQLQSQADQMGYEREMGEYNLTTQQEAQRVQEQQLADRQEQRRSALTNALVSSGGAGYLPEDYELTPRQRELATADTQARIALRTAQAERVGRGGTSTGTGTGAARPDPYTLREFGAALTEERQAATALARLNDPNTRARAIATATRDIYDPTARARAVTEVDTALAQAREAAQARIAGIAERRAALRPGSAPAAPTATAPTAPATQPQAATEPATAAPTGAAPRNSSEALQRGLVTPERLAAARSAGAIARIESDGTIVVRGVNGEQRMPK